MPPPENLRHSITRRMSNFSLSPSPDNALIGVYEAISNSIHAAADSGKPGTITIDITVIRDERGEPDGFVIADSGVGLTDANYNSFRDVDSNYKIKRGGKGVGRLMWLKTFESIKIESRFIEGGKWFQRNFNFVLDDAEPFPEYSLQPVVSGPAQTIITLEKMRAAYKAVVPKREDTLVKSITRHFVKDLISPNAPTIVLYDNNRTVLNDFFKQNIARSADDEFTVEIRGEAISFTVHHFLASNTLRDHETNENTLYFLAHGRVVDRRAIGGLIGLKRLSDGHTYLGLVESDFFNTGVAVERTMFTLNADVIDQVTRVAAEKASLFLTEETAPIRSRQLQIVEHIRKEFPRYIGTIGDPKDFAKKLPLSARDQETVFRTVSLDWYRNKRRVDREIRSNLASAQNKDESNQKVKEAVAKIVSAVDAETKAALADYIAERKVVIDVFNDLLTKVRTGNYKLESEIHNLVCPMGGTSDTLNFQSHNLWLIDERLPYYTFFNSDRTIGQQTSTGQGGKKPDLSFFDITVSFQQQKEAIPIILVEFKRPGRDNYTSSDNPIDQCLDYVSRIKEGTSATDSKGQHVSWIDKESLFFCYVIADITPSLKKVIDLRDLTKTPDGRGYWKFHENLQTMIEIVPFDKIVETTRARHQAFFEKLGIG